MPAPRPYSAGAHCAAHPHPNKPHMRAQKQTCVPQVLTPDPHHTRARTRVTTCSLSSCIFLSTLMQVHTLRQFLSLFSLFARSPAPPTPPCHPASPAAAGPCSSRETGSRWGEGHGSRTAGVVGCGAGQDTCGKIAQAQGPGHLVGHVHPLIQCACRTRFHGCPPGDTQCLFPSACGLTPQGRPREQYPPLAVYGVLIASHGNVCSPSACVLRLLPRAAARAPALGSTPTRSLTQGTGLPT